MLPSFSMNFVRVELNASLMTHLSLNLHILCGGGFLSYLFNPNSPDAGNVYLTSHLLNVWLHVESTKHLENRKQADRN